MWGRGTVEEVHVQCGGRGTDEKVHVQWEGRDELWIYYDVER